MDLRSVLGPLAAVAGCALAIAPFIFAARKGRSQRLWVLAVIAVCAMAMTLQGDVLDCAFVGWAVCHFINIPAMLFVAAGIMAAFAVHGPRLVMGSLKAGWMGDAPGEGMLVASRAALTTLHRMMYVGAGIGALGGLILTLYGANDVKRLGPGIAVMLLAPFTAMIVGAFVVDTAREGLSREGGEGQEGGMVMEATGGGGRWLLWILVATGFVLSAIFAETSLEMFINLPSVILTASGLALAFGAHGVAPTWRALQEGMRGSSALVSREDAPGPGRGGLTQSGEGRVDSRQILDHLRRSLHVVSFIAFVIGVVQMLASMDDPTAIGPAMAVALLCPFYGLFVGEIVVGTLARRLT